MSTPSLYQWAGGEEALKNLFSRFYQQVLQDPVLGEVFVGMSPQHSAKVADFIAEVFGGPALYSGDGVHSHASMVAKHLGRHLTEAQRQRWMQLLLQTADEVGLASDPVSFRISGLSGMGLTDCGDQFGSNGKSN